MFRASAKPIKPSVTIQVSSAEAVPLHAVCCRLGQEGLLLGYNQGPLLTFETVVINSLTQTCYFTKLFKIEQIKHL
jgi:hypothetical protein